MKNWNIYLNRITLLIAIGAIIMGSILFTNNPYLNVVIIIVACFIMMFGCSYIIENTTLTDGEEELLKKVEKFFN